MTIHREKSTNTDAYFDEAIGGSCEGCGSTEPLWSLKARGETTCCPDRKMVSAESWRIRAMAAAEIAVIASQQRDSLKVAIETMVLIAKAREGNLARAVKDRDDYRELADGFGAPLEALIPTIDILESRFGAALAEREAGK